MLAACGEPASRETSANEVAETLRSVRVAPGLSETTREIVDARGPDLPRAVQDRMMARRHNVRHCITPEQAARPEGGFLAAQGGNDCIYRDFTMTEGRMSGTMTCGNGDLPGTMTTQMEGNYGTEAYDMRMSMEASGMPEGADIRVEARVRGRRLGPCPAANEGQAR